MEGGLFSFFTLLAWAEGASSKNKTHVPPGLWEQGPPAYCFGIWGRTGLERDTAEWIQAQGEQRGQGCCTFKKRVEEIFSLACDKFFCNVHLHVRRKGN